MKGVNKPISLKEMNDTINRIANLRKEHTEKALVEIIQKYDFIVGSKDTKHKLTKALPQGANIVYSPYIKDPTIVYAVKKFDIMNLFSEPYNEEGRKEIVMTNLEHYGTLYLKYLKVRKKGEGSVLSFSKHLHYCFENTGREPIPSEYLKWLLESFEVVEDD